MADAEFVMVADGLFPVEYQRMEAMDEESEDWPIAAPRAVAQSRESVSKAAVESEALLSEVLAAGRGPGEEGAHIDKTSSVSRGSKRRSSRRFKGLLVEDTDYYMVSVAWLSLVAAKLKEYRSDSKTDFLVAIDNANLVERYTQWGCEVRDELREGVDYRLVEAITWHSLIALFGGGPEVCRRAIKDRSGQATLDVCGVTLHYLWTEDDHIAPQYLRANFSSWDRVGDVMEEILRRADVKKENAGKRMWQMGSDGHPRSLLDENGLLCDFDLARGDWMLIEIQHKASWLIDEETALNSGNSIRARTPSSAKSGQVVPGGLLGLYNLRNTCYMNSMLQCLSNVPPLRDYFLSGDFVKEINKANALGTGGKLAGAYGDLVSRMWKAGGTAKAISPRQFKEVLDKCKPDFAGYLQQDSQELLGTLLDSFHEDVNRVKKKPSPPAVESNRRPLPVVAKESEEVYKMRNDSKVADLFCGMLMSQVVCPQKTCDNESVTFDPYMMLALPVEQGPNRLQSVRVVVVESGEEVDVLVPAEGFSLHIRNSVAQRLGIDASDLLLAEVSLHKIIRVLSDAAKVESLNNDTQVYAYQDKKAALHLEMLHGDFITFKRSRLPTSGRATITVDENHLEQPGLGDTEYDVTWPLPTLEEDDLGNASSSIILPRELQDADAESIESCPFRKGQIWIGSLEQTQYPHTRFPVRIEIAGVIKVGGEVVLYMLMDVNRTVLGNRVEQETRMMIGTYSQEKKKSVPVKPTQPAPPTSPSKSGPLSLISKVSPKNVTKALFGATRRASRFSFDSKRDKSDSTQESRKSSGKSPTTPTLPASPPPSPGFSPLIVGHVDMVSLPWRVLNFPNPGEPSILQQQRGFSASGSLDVSGKAFYGKVVWGSGFHGAMDLFVRLASDTLNQQDRSAATGEDATQPRASRDLDEEDEGAPGRTSYRRDKETSTDRKLAVNSTRAVRVVHSIVGDTREFALDPDFFIVDKRSTEGEVVQVVLARFLQKLKKRTKVALRAEDLLCSVVRVGKNYSTEELTNAQVGRVITKDSKLAFFATKHSFLRLQVKWDAKSPYVTHFPTVPRAPATGNTNLRIDDCLDLFCKPEYLSEMDSWYCSKCKEHREALKTLSIWSLPSVLVLCLKRFSQESETYTHKVERQVDFPVEGLDLARYVKSSNMNGKSTLYDLCAVSSHYGGLGSGHYTAFSRNENNGAWYEFDDETVIKVEDISQVVSKSAYVLFYLRRDLRPKAWR